MCSDVFTFQSSLPQHLLALAWPARRVAVALGARYNRGMTDAEFRLWIASDEGKAAKEWAWRHGMMLVYPTIAEQLAKVVARIKPATARKRLLRDRS